MLICSNQLKHTTVSNMETAENGTLFSLGLFNGPFYKGIVTVTYLIAAVIFIGNGFTITAIIIYKPLQTKTNIFILNLCVADIYIGIVNTLAYATIITAEEFFSISVKTYFLIAGFTTSAFTLVDIAIERFISIQYPLKYEQIMTRTFILSVLLVTWILPFAVLLTGAAIQPVITPDQNLAENIGYQLIISMQYLYFVLGAVVVAIYIHILRIAFKQAKEIKKNMIETAEKARFKSEMKATITLGLVVLAYVLSWTPMCILSTLDMIKILTYDIHYYRTLMVISTIGYCNSAVNFFIYAWKNTSFRAAYSLILKCKCKKHGLIDPTSLQ